MDAAGKTAADAEAAGNAGARAETRNPVWPGN